MRIVLAAACILFFAGCAHETPRERNLVGAASVAAFDHSLGALGEQLSIPGMAYAVVQAGEVVASGAISSDQSAAIGIDTPLRFASVTKAMTATLLMRAESEGRLSLDDSAATWAPEFAGRPEITVRHLAAHVSEGAPGTEFVYGTTRYSKLGPVLAAAYGEGSYGDVLRAHIVEPLGMTWRDSPYLGAHAGFVSTVSDMALFVGALQTGALVSEASFNAMTTPYRNAAGAAQPVGVGFFSQEIGRARVVWSFGQDDPDHSSALVLMLPDRDLALVLLANTDALANPFRLLMGDVRTSPFAAAFLEAFAPDVGAGISARDRAIQSLLIAAAREDIDAASVALDAVMAHGPPLENDFALHFVAAHLASPETERYWDTLDGAVLAAHPANRWALLFSAELRTALHQPAAAGERYEALLALPNQEPDFLAMLFRAWAFGGLAQIYKDGDPALALEYADRGLASEVGGETREQLERFRAEIAGHVRP